MYDLGGVAGQPIIGFQRWKDPGPFGQAHLVDQINLDQFLGVIGGLVQATYAFQGMELVAIAASETESPRRNIKRAIRRVFLRICIFYILGIFVIGLTVASNDPLLLSRTDTELSTSQSPFIIAINHAGISVLPSVVNAGFLTSAFSAGNSFLFCSSRILYGLAIRHQAPRIFTYCTKQGLPIIAVVVTSSFSLLSFVNVNTGAVKGFTDLVNLATVTGLFTWWSINLTYIFFCKRLDIVHFYGTLIFLLRRSRNESPGHESTRACVSQHMAALSSHLWCGMVHHIRSPNGLSFIFQVHAARYWRITFFV